MRRAGLRTRFTAGFTAGALLLAASMAFASYQITRRSLLLDREQTAIRAAHYDAAIVQAGISGNLPDIGAVLRSLATGESRRVVLQRDGTWYACTADSCGLVKAIPAALQAA